MAGVGTVDIKKTTEKAILSTKSNNTQEYLGVSLFNQFIMKQIC
jgi:hypothetical protein